MNILELIGRALLSGLGESLSLLWESLYGLVLGFLISAVVQVLIGERTIKRFASDTPGGVAAMAGFGIISSSCSYASAAVARSLYHRGAGPRASFAYLVSSTNMNVAILILFWVLVGWKFALAEFLGGIIIIAVVTTGLSLLFPGDKLERMREQVPQLVLGDVVTEDVICGMKGERKHAVEHGGRTFLFCNAQHARQFRQDPKEYADRLTGPGTQTTKGPAALARRIDETIAKDVVCGMDGTEEYRADYGAKSYLFCSGGCRSSFWNDPMRYLKPHQQAGDSPIHVKAEHDPPRARLGSLRTWYEVTQKFVGDVKMLRNELMVGYLIAGFAEALVPHQWLSGALQQVGHVPVIGYVLLLLLGLAIAVATFVCSMGNVPVAQFLKLAGIPLGANTAYIYGDLLILPLVQIYRKSFAPQLTAAFLGLFILGAVIAGGLMELLIGHLPGGL